MHPLFDLTGKIAIVTNCATELGQQMAEALAEAGASIIGLGMQDMQTVSQAVERYGVPFEAVQADLAVCDAQALVQDIVARYKKIDILVDYANDQDDGSDPEAISWSDYERVIANNQTAVVKLALAVYAQMRKQKTGGKIIIVSSALADRTAPNALAYAVSKNAVIGLMRTLSIAGAQHKIWVNAMSPGLIETQAVANLSNYSELVDLVIERLPTKKLGKPQNIRGLTVFLSAKASDYTVGQIFHMDGGFTTRT